MVCQAYDPWDMLSDVVTVPLTTSWTHYTVELTAWDDDTNANIGFYLGADSPSVYIDNVRFWEKQDTKITDLTPEISVIYDDPDTPDTATNYQLQVD